MGRYQAKDVCEVWNQIYASRCDASSDKIIRTTLTYNNIYVCHSYLSTLSSNSSFLAYNGSPKIGDPKLLSTTRTWCRCPESGFTKNRRSRGEVVGDVTIFASFCCALFLGDRLKCLSRVFGRVVLTKRVEEGRRSLRVNFICDRRLGAKSPVT